MIKQDAIESANSIKLMFPAPDLLYEGSKRPVTDMSLFRNSLSIKAKADNIIDGRITIDGQIWNIIPVTRYASGMSRGQFFKREAKEEIYGTFYYLEPESSTGLVYRTALKAFNKTDAMIKLGILNIKQPGVSDIVTEAGLHIRGYYPRDLIMTPMQASELKRWRYAWEDDIQDSVDPAMLPQIPHYAGDYLELYAEEDLFDQPLCIAAKAAGYDIIILESMVGGFQIVTEVLDARDERREPPQSGLSSIRHYLRISPTRAPQTLFS